MNAPDPRVKATAAAHARASKTCVIFAEPPASAHYGWGWRAGDKRSKGLFRYLYECVQDAHKHGYAVEIADVAESLRTRQNVQGPG